MTLAKVKEKLLQMDEITVLELLDLKTEDLVEAFPERLQKRLGYISKELEMVVDEEHKMTEINFDE